MKNWMTTLFGALAAVGKYLEMQPQPIVKTSGEILSIISLFLLGSTAKQYNVTGGTKQQ